MTPLVWTIQDDMVAMAEGWWFDFGSVGWHLARNPHHRATAVWPGFTTDEEALAFVAKSASAGSVVHKKAMAWLAQQTRPATLTKDQQIAVMNSRIAEDARSFERDQRLIRRLREQLAKASAVARLAAKANSLAFSDPGDACRFTVVLKAWDGGR